MSGGGGARYRHELIVLAGGTQPSSSASADDSGAGRGGGAGIVGDGTTSSSGGGGNVLQKLQLTEGENFVSVHVAPPPSADGDEGPDEGELPPVPTLSIGPDPTVNAASGDGDGGSSSAAVVLLVDVDGQYVAVKDVRDVTGVNNVGDDVDLASAAAAAAAGAELVLSRRRRMRRSREQNEDGGAAHEQAAKAATGTADRLNKHIAGVANNNNVEENYDTEDNKQQMKQDGTATGSSCEHDNDDDVERGYDTDDETDNVEGGSSGNAAASGKNRASMRQDDGIVGDDEPGVGSSGRSASRSRRAAEGAGAGAELFANGANGQDVIGGGETFEYCAPEALPHRQMRFLRKGDRVALRFGVSGRNDRQATTTAAAAAAPAILRIEYRQHRVGGEADDGTGDALMTPVDAVTQLLSNSEGGPKNDSNNKSNAAKGNNFFPAGGNARGDGGGGPAPAQPSTFSADAAVRRLVGIPVPGGASGKGSSSSKGASTNAAVVVDTTAAVAASGAVPTDKHGGPAAMGVGTPDASSSARKSAAQQQQKHCSHSPQDAGGNQEGEVDDEMEEYSYLTGEVIMNDQGYVSAMTGDEENETVQSADMAHRQRSRIEAANRALGIDTAVETGKSALPQKEQAVEQQQQTQSLQSGQSDGEARVGDADEDAATASAVVLGDGPGRGNRASEGTSNAIVPPGAIEFSRQPQQMPPPPSAVEVTGIAVSSSAKNIDEKECGDGEEDFSDKKLASSNVETAEAVQMDVEKENMEVDTAVVAVHNDTRPAKEETFGDAKEEMLFLTAQEVEENDADEDVDKGSSGGRDSIEAVEMKDADSADSGEVSNEDADGEEEEEGGALTQAYPMPTSPGGNEVGATTPDSGLLSHTSNNDDVDDDETTTAGPDQNDTGHDIYEQPTQPHPGFSPAESPGKFDMETQPFLSSTPSPARSTQNRSDTGVRTSPPLSVVEEEEGGEGAPNENNNDDDSVTTAGSGALIPDKQKASESFNNIENESIPTDAAVAALSLPTSVTGGDIPKPDIQDNTKDDDSDATEDENAIITDAAVCDPASLLTRDAGEEARETLKLPLRRNSNDDSETEDENDIMSPQQNRGQEKTVQASINMEAEDDGSDIVNRESGDAMVTGPVEARMVGENLLTSIARRANESSGSFRRDSASSEETTVYGMDVSVDAEEAAAIALEKDAKTPQEESLDESTRIAAQEEAKRLLREQELLVARECELQILTQERLEANRSFLIEARARRKAKEEDLRIAAEKNAIEKQRQKEERRDAAEKAEQERISREKSEREFFETERVAKEKAEQDRIAADKATAEADAKNKRQEEEKRIAAETAAAKKVNADAAVENNRSEEAQLVANEKGEQEPMTGEEKTSDEDTAEDAADVAEQAQASIEEEERVKQDVVAEAKHIAEEKTEANAKVKAEAKTAAAAAEEQRIVAEAEAKDEAEAEAETKVAEAKAQAVAAADAEGQVAAENAEREGTDQEITEQGRLDAERLAEEDNAAAKTEPKRSAKKKAAVAASFSDEKEASSPKRQKRAMHSLRSEDKKEEKSENEEIRIIITGIGVTAKHKKMVQAIDGVLVEKVEDAITATHAIAGDGKTALRRTPKLMICLCKTSNILDLKWLTDSAKAKKALNPNDYLLLNDKQAEKSYDFIMSETLENGKSVRSERGGLLGGWSIHFCKGVAGKKAPPENELRLIVGAAGGTMLKSITVKATKNVEAEKIILITSDPATSAQNSDKDVKRLSALGAKVFTTSWLFHCIITQQLHQIDRDPVHAEDVETPASSAKKGGRKRKAATPRSSSPKRESSRRRRK